MAEEFGVADNILTNISFGHDVLLQLIHVQSIAVAFYVYITK